MTSTTTAYERAEQDRGDREYDLIDRAASTTVMLDLEHLEGMEMAFSDYHGSVCGIAHARAVKHLKVGDLDVQYIECPICGRGYKSVRAPSGLCSYEQL